MSFSDESHPGRSGRYPRRRRLLTASVVGLTLLLGLAAPVRALKMPTEPPQEGRVVGSRPFDIDLKDLDGHRHSLKELKGRAVVQVVFWATWCVPCIQEIPTLREAYAKYRDRGLEVLAVVLNIDQTPEGVRAVARDYKINYPVLWDATGQARDRYRISMIPQNYLIDRGGVIRYAGSNLPNDYDALLGKLLEEDGATRSSR